MTSCQFGSGWKAWPTGERLPRRQAMRLTARVRHELLRIDSECIEHRRREIARGHRIGDDFEILAIIIALALFLFGVASLVRQERIKIGLGAVGAVILVYSIVRLIQLGNPAGVTLSLLF